MKYQFLLSFLLLFGHIYCQDIQSSLSLQEAVDYALENNRQSKNAARDIGAEGFLTHFGVIGGELTIIGNVLGRFS